MDEILKQCKNSDNYSNIVKYINDNKKNLNTNDFVKINKKLSNNLSENRRNEKFVNISIFENSEIDCQDSSKLDNNKINDLNSITYREYFINKSPIKHLDSKTNKSLKEIPLILENLNDKKKNKENINNIIDNDSFEIYKKLNNCKDINKNYCEKLKNNKEYVTDYSFKEKNDDSYIFSNLNLLNDKNFLENNNFKEREIYYLI